MSHDRPAVPELIMPKPKKNPDVHRRARTIALWVLLGYAPTLIYTVVSSMMAGSAHGLWMTPAFLGLATLFGYLAGEAYDDFVADADTVGEVFGGWAFTLLWVALCCVLAGGAIAAPWVT